MKHPAAAIAFYVPSAALVESTPASVAAYWSWIDAAVERAPAPLGDGGGPCTWLGPYNWTLQTFLELRAAGLACVLNATIPDEGVIVSHGDFLPPAFVPSKRQFLVEIKPDRPLQCQFANVVITQNPRDPIAGPPWSWFVRSASVTYWPQPGLIPREPSRADRFENVGFMGREQNLFDEPAISEGLARRGLTWLMVPPERWHDYRALDAVVAVRPPAPPAHARESAFFATNQKPASKLVNAWLAGVPAILSPDDAFEDLRTSPLDYLVARSAPEVLAQIDRLRSDSALRRAMVERGCERSVAFSRVHIAARWLALFENEILPAYQSWQESWLQRSVTYGSRRVLHAIRWRLERRRASSTA